MDLDTEMLSCKEENGAGLEDFEVRGPKDSMQPRNKNQNEDVVVSGSVGDTD